MTCPLAVALGVWQDAAGPEQGRDVGPWNRCALAEETTRVAATPLYGPGAGLEELAAGLALEVVPGEESQERRVRVLESWSPGEAPELRGIEAAQLYAVKVDSRRDHWALAVRTEYGWFTTPVLASSHQVGMMGLRESLACEGLAQEAGRLRARAASP